MHTLDYAPDHLLLVAAAPECGVSTPVGGARIFDIGGLSFADVVGDDVCWPLASDETVRDATDDAYAEPLNVDVSIVVVLPESVSCGIRSATAARQLEQGTFRARNVRFVSSSSRRLRHISSRFLTVMFCLA